MNDGGRALGRGRPLQLVDGDGLEDRLEQVELAVDEEEAALTEEPPAGGPVMTGSTTAAIGSARVTPSAATWRSWTSKAHERISRRTQIGGQASPGASNRTPSA